MLATLYDLARVWAAQGKKVEAVELLTVVLHNPVSNLPLLLRNEGTILSQAAKRLRANLEADLEPEIYRYAWGRGQGLPLETAVAGLLR